jgi:hypothetical protein
VANSALIEESPSLATPELLLRLRVWLRRWSLDQRLGQGDDPAGTAELALRAEQLTSRKQRDSIAAQIERIVEAAEEPASPLSSAAPLCRGEILAQRPLLLTLAEELRGSGSVRAQGVALARQLLVDGASPLYVPCAEGALDRAIDGARWSLLHADAGER